MDVDEVERAAVACVEEIRQIVETRCATAVGNGRRGELGFASKGLHVILIDGGCVGGFQVGLAGIVGFVGGEELGDATGADEVGDGVHPIGALEARVHA